MEFTFIYCLLDPESGKIRYVGQSRDPLTRWKKHIRTITPDHRGCWIVSLRRRGLVPRLEILEKISASDWQTTEREYICLFRRLGADLVNSSDGGAGVFNPSVQTREKLRLAKLGKPVSLETRAKLSLAHKGRFAGKNNPNFGKIASKETRARQRASHLGKKLPKEQIEKIRLASTGKKHSVASIEKMRAGKKGCVFSEQHKARLSASHMGNVVLPETRRKISLGLKASYASGARGVNKPLTKSPT